MSSVEEAKQQSQIKTAQTTPTNRPSDATSAASSCVVDDNSDLVPQQQQQRQKRQKAKASADGDNRKAETIVAMEAGSNLTENVIHVISPTAVVAASVDSSTNSAVTVTPSVHTITISGNNLSIPFSSSLVRYFHVSFPLLSLHCYLYLFKNRKENISIHSAHPLQLFPLGYMFCGIHLLHSSLPLLHTCISLLFFCFFFFFLHMFVRNLLITRFIHPS